jgi:hypothetical protein
VCCRVTLDLRAGGGGVMHVLSSWGVVILFFIGYKCVFSPPNMIEEEAQLLVSALALVYGLFCF